MFVFILLSHLFIQICYRKQVKGSLHLPHLADFPIRTLLFRFNFLLLVFTRSVLSISASIRSNSISLNLFQTYLPLFVSFKQSQYHYCLFAATIYVTRAREPTISNPYETFIANLFCAARSTFAFIFTQSFISLLVF